MKNLFNRATLVALSLSLFANGLNAGALEKSKALVRAAVNIACQNKKTAIVSGVACAFLLQATWRARNTEYWQNVVWKDSKKKARQSLFHIIKQTACGLVNNNILNYIAYGAYAFVANPQHFNFVYSANKKISDLDSNINDLNTIITQNNKKIADQNNAHEDKNNVIEDLNLTFEKNKDENEINDNNLQTSTIEKTNTLKNNSSGTL